jgi:hypothetical protein
MPSPITTGSFTDERSCPGFQAQSVLELLFGGNMLEGTFKAVIWVALLAAVLAWTTFR